MKKINNNKLSMFFKTNAVWIIPLLLIISLISISTHYRMYSSSLVVSDDWAENSVISMYKSQISKNVDINYPTLPKENKDRLVNDQLNEYLLSHREDVDKQISEYSKSLRKHFQYEDENGDSYTYLLAIDPYLWYGYGKNYLECGHTGCAINKDGEYRNLRNGRYGSDRKMPYISYLGILIYKISNLLSSIPLMQAFFLIPVVLIGLAIIPAFFLGRKLGGNIGGFFAGLIIAINSALLSRTPAGFSDTDSANIVFPLFIMWFFIESFYAKTLKKTLVYSVLGGISFFLYSHFWITTPTYGFLIASSVIYLGVLVVLKIVNSEKFKISALKDVLKDPAIKMFYFLGISLFFLVLSKGLKYITNIVMEPLNFMTLKQVGIKSLWPNVLTTVAEFNTVSVKEIIFQMGGKILFVIALIGLVLSLVYKHKKTNQKYTLFSILVIVWFIGTTYAFTKGTRFAILMVPAFAVAFGTGLGLLYNYWSNFTYKEFKLHKSISTIIFLLIVMILFISPFQSAYGISKSEVPSFNDAWSESLKDIKGDAEDGYGYITTWWDFGHWFVANGIRVTFDGGDQGERIHWVGKSFLTSNENESVGIMRMLNCGQENAPHVIECYLSKNNWIWKDKVDGQGECDGLVDQENTVKAIDILNNLFVLDKQGANNLLQDNGFTSSQIGEILDLTHCDNLLPQYVIASGDMVGKSGVWAHFGSWDFRRAMIYQKIKSLPYNEGISVLKEEFNMSDSKASRYYNEINMNDGDHWISGWPTYGSDRGCTQVSENNLKCAISVSNGLIPVDVNLTSHDVSINVKGEVLNPVSFVYAKGNKVIEKKYNNSGMDFSVVLYKKRGSYNLVVSDKSLANSIFTRLFYLEGNGLRYIKPFDSKTQITGSKILTYKVNWTSNDKTDIYTKREVKAAHILITLDNRSESDALDLINRIRDNLTEDNFKEMAKEYSEGPSSVNGGELGWFSKGMMVKPFEDSVFSLKKGQISEPVKTQFGYHLILLEDKRNE